MQSTRTITCTLLAAGVLSLVTWVSAARADVVLFDDTFADADWTATVLWIYYGSTQSDWQEESGGNPDAFRMIDHTMTPLGGVAVTHLYEASVYTPSTDGAITSIDYSEDRIQFDMPFPGAYTDALPVLLQGGVLYVGPDMPIVHQTWETATWNMLHASSFRSGAYTSPDFTSTGGTIQFGYLRVNDADIGTNYEIRSGIDNWSMTIRSPGPTSVTRPGQGPGRALRVRGTNVLSRAITIVCERSDAERIELCVTDAAGRIVRSFGSDASAAREVERVWDGTDDSGRRVPRGVYVVQMRTERGAAALRVVVAGG